MPASRPWCPRPNPVPSSPSLTVSRRGADRVRGGHPWIYRSDIADVDGRAGRRRVGGRPARAASSGSGLYSDRSQIALRMLSREATWPAGAWRPALAQAIAFRESLGIDATAYRLVHGEGDLPPGAHRRPLRRLPGRAGACRRGSTDAPPGDSRGAGGAGRPAGHPRAQRPEGADARGARADGRRCCTARCREWCGCARGACSTDVDLWHGQKTGLFLDQRENREAAAAVRARPRARRFSYNGGFALQLAPGARVGARARCLGRGRGGASAERRAERDRRTSRRALANVFDELRELERAGERFDTIVLDPPAFAKSRAALTSRAVGLQGDQPPRAQAAPARRHPRHLHAAPTTWTRRPSARWSTRRPSTRRWR